MWHMVHTMYTHICIHLSFHELIKPRYLHRCTMSQSPMGQLGLQTFEYQRKSKAVEFITAEILCLVTNVCVICMTCGLHCSSGRLCCTTAAEAPGNNFSHDHDCYWIICHREALGNDRVASQLPTTSHMPVWHQFTVADCSLHNPHPLTSHSPVWDPKAFSSGKPSNAWATPLCSN